MNVAERNTWVGRALVEELARLDTPLVCLAPGARCAPLSMALGATDRVPWTTFVDERAAAFHALGVGRATGRPAAVITTSGTAVGNLVPAAMEADQAGVPLLLLTADRPAELRHTAANQTVLQSQILAPLTRFHADLPCSEPALPFTGLLSTLDEAVNRATRDRGPVHLDLQFREPLGPAASPVPDALQTWFDEPDPLPWTQCVPSEPVQSSPIELRAKRGLVVVGSLPRSAQAPVRALLTALGWPTVCSPDSGLRGLRGLDSALSDPELARALQPDLVLWIGGAVVSKRLVAWLREARVPVVSLTQRGSRVDPGFVVRVRHTVAYEQVRLKAPQRADADWQAAWSALHTASSQVADQAAQSWSELAAARAVLSASSSVFLGPSLPVRLADWMGSDETVLLDANRGASGIDGVLATAAGWARFTPDARVLLGDLTLLHDQGSLPLVRDLPLQAVVFNNQGGSIFGMLPFGEVRGFDRVFRNEHTQNLSPLAAAHGLRTATVTDLAGLHDALASDVDLVEAQFEHAATIEAVRGFHADTVGAVRAALL